MWGVRRGGCKPLDFQSRDRGFKSHTPYQTFYVDRSSIMAERCAVNAVGAGSSPADQPKSSCGALGKSGQSHLILDQEIIGSNPIRAASISDGTVAER